MENVVNYLFTPCSECHDSVQKNQKLFLVIFYKVFLFVFCKLQLLCQLEEFMLGWGGYGQKIMSWSTVHL